MSDVARGKGSRPMCVVKLRQVVAGSPRCVGAAGVVDRRADALSGSNLARGAARDPLEEDAAGH